MVIYKNIINWCRVDFLSYVTRLIASVNISSSYVNDVKTYRHHQVMTEVNIDQYLFITTYLIKF